MRSIVINSALLVAVAALLSLNWILRADPEHRNFEVLPDMAKAVAFQSFSSNPSFRNGQTLQKPVAGTVIRGMMPLHYAATPADAQRAARELFNPLKVADAAAVKRGGEMYVIYCEICHGVTGKGDGPVARRGFPTPPSLLAAKALKLADGQIFHIVTYGQNNMPSYASQIDRGDRWKIILYLRSLQRGPVQ